MSVIMTQYTVPASSTVPVFQIPPGLFSATMYNLGTQAVYLGTSPNVTTGNGLVLHTVPTTFQGAMTSRAAMVYATTGGASAGVINLLMITDQ